MERVKNICPERVKGSKDEIIVKYYHYGFNAAENILIIKKIEEDGYEIGVITPQPKEKIKVTPISASYIFSNNDEFKFFEEAKYIKNGRYKIKLHKDVYLAIKLDYFDGEVGGIRLNKDSYFMVLKNRDPFVLKREEDENGKEKYYFLSIEDNFLFALLNPDKFVDEYKKENKIYKIDDLPIYTNFEWKKLALDCFVKCISVIRGIPHKNYIDDGIICGLRLAKIDDYLFFIVSKSEKEKFYKIFKLKENEINKDFDNFLYDYFDKLDIPNLVKMTYKDVKVFKVRKNSKVEKNYFGSSVGLLFMYKDNEKIYTDTIHMYSKSVLTTKEIVKKIEEFLDSIKVKKQNEEKEEKKNKISPKI